MLSRDEREYVGMLYERKFDILEDLRKKQNVLTSFRNDGWEDQEISPLLLQEVADLQKQYNEVEAMIQRHISEKKTGVSMHQ